MAEPVTVGNVESLRRQATGLLTRASQLRCHADHMPGYLPIENYGLIGNMRTCALVGMDGSLDFMCWYVPTNKLCKQEQRIVTDHGDARWNRPDFDSPSVFCRLLDADKGGYFSICPPHGATFTTKQQYLPSSNILQTRYIHEDGVVDLIDFFPRPKNSNVMTKVASKQMPYREAIMVQDELKKWLVRRVECIRGTVDLGTMSRDELLHTTD